LAIGYDKFCKVAIDVITGKLSIIAQVFVVIFAKRAMPAGFAQSGNTHFITPTKCLHLLSYVFDRSNDLMTENDRQL